MLWETHERCELPRKRTDDHDAGAAATATIGGRASRDIRLVCRCGGGADLGHDLALHPGSQALRCLRMQAGTGGMGEVRWFMRCHGGSARTCAERVMQLWHHGVNGLTLGTMTVLTTTLAPAVRN